MSSICDDCRYAEWKRTEAGRLHPAKTGRCTYLKQHPLDLRVPASFYWSGWQSVPAPSGGYIERGRNGFSATACDFKTVSPNPKDMADRTDQPQPISDAPKGEPFLVWHAGEWRVVQRYDGPYGVFDDLVIDPRSGRFWGARCWWPLPPPQSSNEGQLP